MEKSNWEGLIIQVSGARALVEVGKEQIPCNLRGRFRKEQGEFQIAAGDRVEISLPSDESGEGTIEIVLPRKSALSRYDSKRRSGERIVVANLDKLFIVASVRRPPVSYGFLDRLLAAAARGGVTAVVCLNKIDLAAGEEEIEEFVSIYRSCGYRVIAASALDGRGVNEVDGEIGAGIYAFAGESGVGKSSLLMRIDPRLQLKVRETTLKTGRGRHTTSFSRLFRIKDGYVADTPGIQSFKFPGKKKQDVSSCFPEFESYEGDCRFNPCTHSHEPGCAVRKALEAGLIQPTRYKSYLDILSELDARERST